jgi:hypothetical protein
MNCYTHSRSPAVGLCVVCQKAVCRECVGSAAPRVVCRTCLQQRSVFGYEYRSRMSIGGWPLVHICTGIDPATMRPRIARGVVAIGNVAIGGLAIAGLSFGLVTFGGASFGLLFALGGMSIGLGLSLGGVAIGSIAIGGVAVGLMYALGGLPFGPAVIGPRECDPAAFEFFKQWFGSVVPPRCR